MQKKLEGIDTSRRGFLCISVLNHSGWCKYLDKSETVLTASSIVLNTYYNYLHGVKISFLCSLLFSKEKSQNANDCTVISMNIDGSLTPLRFILCTSLTLRYSRLNHLNVKKKIHFSIKCTNWRIFCLLQSWVSTTRRNVWPHGEWVSFTEFSHGIN